MAKTDYSTVCPFITVYNIETQIVFLVKVFNASVKEQLRAPDGKINFAEVKIGDTVLMINRLSDDGKIKPSANYVFINDADKIFKLAILNGGTEITKPDNKFYGIREAGFTDQQGNTWWVGEYLKDVTTKEMEAEFAKRQTKEQE